MLEMMLGAQVAKVVVPDDTGLGPTTLVGYEINKSDPTKVHGYFGRIPVAQFITGSALATSLNVTTGSATAAISFWLKFLVDGKVLVIPQYALRTGFSFRSIYLAGLAYGVDGPGITPSGVATNQLRTVTLGGYVYKVRLIKGLTTDTIAVNKSNTFASSYPETALSEFTRMIYSVAPAIGTGTKWDTLTLAELGFSPSIGSFNWMLEENTAKTGDRIVRGFTSGDRFSADVSTSTDASYGWRPVLELVGKA